VRTRELLAVALGGALGTLARVGALEATGHLASGALLATFIANSVGAFGLAFVVSRGLPEAPSWLLPGVTIGFFGSYTTFSGIALIAIIQTIDIALMYLGATLLTAVVAVLLGRVLGKLARPGALA
jgi:fluoride exporter